MPSCFFSNRLVSVQVVHPYSSIDMTAAWKKLRFILSVRFDFHMIESLSIAVHAFVSRVSMSFWLMRRCFPGRWICQPVSERFCLQHKYRQKNNKNKKIEMGRKTTVWIFQETNYCDCTWETKTCWRKRNLKREIESFLIAAQNKAIIYVKVKISKILQNSKCTLCDEKDEMIDNIISECSKLVGLVSLFNGISILVSYLMPKPFS